MTIKESISQWLSTARNFPHAYQTGPVTFSTSVDVMLMWWFVLKSPVMKQWTGLWPRTPPPSIPSNIKRYGLWKVSWRYKHNSKAPIFLLCIDRRCGYEWDLFILLLDHVTPTSTPIAQGVSMAVEQCTCSHAGPLLLKWSLGGMCVPHAGSQLSILAPFFGYSLAPLKNISLTAPREEEQRSNDFFA